MPPMPGDFDPLVYDTAAEGGDGDGEISKDEAIRAVQDFFRQEITRDQVLDGGAGLLRQPPELARSHKADAGIGIGKEEEAW